MRLGRCQAFHCSGCCGEDLNSYQPSLDLEIRREGAKSLTVLVSTKMVVLPRPPGLIPSPASGWLCVVSASYDSRDIPIEA